MSKLSQFTGGGIKSVQRGQSTVNGASSTLDVTISSVNTAKSFVSFGGSTTQSGSSTSDLAIVFLANSTTIRLSRALTASNSQVAWEVVEFY